MDDAPDLIKFDTTMAGAEVTPIVVVTERYDDPEATYRAYKAGLEAAGRRFEMIYVLDGPHPAVHATLSRLKAQGEPLQIVQLLRSFGEATALNIGARRARSEMILCLPAYLQIDPMEIYKLIGSDVDPSQIVVAVRDRHHDAWLNALRAKAYNLLLSRLTGSRFHDVGCRAKVIPTEALQEIRLYGDLLQFSALIAERHGYRVKEVTVRQAASDSGQRLYRPAAYARHVFDVFAISFLTVFNNKPLRFFGLLGLGFGLLGLLLGVTVAAQRFVEGTPLADRPLFVICVLFIVCGIQTISLGLIGELLIFTRARDTADYWIDKTVGLTDGERRSVTD